MVDHNQILSSKLAKQREAFELVRSLSKTDFTYLDSLFLLAFAFPDIFLQIWM